MAETKELKEGKIYGFIAYLWILCLIPILLKKDNKFAMFHAKQGLILFICEIGLTIIGIIPLLGQLVSTIGLLACAILSLIGMIQALMGNQWKMPVLGEYAEKITI